MFVNDTVYNYRLTLVICSININEYDIKCLKNLMILSIYKEEVDNLDMKYIVSDVELENVPRWWESKTDIWVLVPISLIYYRFIVRFTIGLEHNIPSPVLPGTDVFSVDV